MTVEQLILSKFTAFDEETTFDFCPGINVLIGANAIGKTHVLKTIYSIVKVCEKINREEISSQKDIEAMFQSKLLGVFKPNSIGRLVHQGQDKHKSLVSVTCQNMQLTFTITTQHQVSLISTLPNVNAFLNSSSALYLPPHEFLSLYQGFISLYQNRETAFDETYYDLSVALNALPLRGAKLTEVKNLLKPLEKAIKTKVIQENGKFYLKLPEGKLEAHLVSEGYRKLGQLIYLINNGSLTHNNILFWDEPAANLNPKVITIVVDFLRVLAKAGVQIFIATHDYLLSQELSLLAEYPSDSSLKFFALHKPNKRGGVVVESGSNLTEIDHNPILDEFAAHYDREVLLFQNS